MQLSRRTAQLFCVMTRPSAFEMRTDTHCWIASFSRKQKYGGLEFSYLPRIHKGANNMLVLYLWFLGKSKRIHHIYKAYKISRNFFKGNCIYIYRQELAHSNEAMCHQGKLGRKSVCLAGELVVGSKVAPPVHCLAAPILNWSKHCSM